MDIDRSLVSILIPCYNAERWIGEAIESALAQIWNPKEVVVVDDGSTDKSLEIIRKFDGRIRWETGPNRGGNSARNRLHELASGEWLQYLDADDCLLETKIARQMEFLKASSTPMDVVFGPITLEDRARDLVRRELLPIPEPHDPWVLLARWYLPQTGSPLWRKSALQEVGGWAVNQPCCQEHELYLRLLMAKKSFRYCPETGAVYRQWSDGTVCTRNLPLVHRERLKIEQRAESHLQASGELSEERLRAINQARFEIARMAWLYDRDFARQIVSTIRRSCPAFVPGGAAAPRQYRAVYRLFGFNAAEKIATWKRVYI